MGISLLPRLCVCACVCIREGPRPRLPKTRKGPAVEPPGISDATLKGPGNLQGPEHLGIALKGWRPTDSNCDRTKNEIKQTQRNNCALHQPISILHSHQTQKRHPYPHSRTTRMYAHTIPMVTNNPPILHPFPLCPPCQGVQTRKCWRHFSFFFFPVQFRGTEPSAAVQGGHFLCR